MKKLLLLAMGAMMSVASFAQGEDVTTLIANSGFDEDLTWQADGSKKEIVDQSTVLSNRSIAGIAADKSVYALVNPNGNGEGQTVNKRKVEPERTLEATNGFIGQVQGWTVETNQTFPKCEWVYFGTLPYDLAERAIPVADDGDSYLTAPAKPDAFNGSDNIGFAYLRAGWGGRAVYKQTVNLPCAKYRLEYWAININQSASNGKNLSQVTCRKDVWKDETGFNDLEWTKHTIEFTPTSEFTMEFGFESSGGSGSNPFLCIDGIKLYRIGEADPDELLKAQYNDCQDLLNEASGTGYDRLASYISDYMMELDDKAGEEPEVILAAIEQADRDMANFRAAIAETANIDAILAKIDNLLKTTDFAGKDALQAAYDKFSSYKDGDPDEGEDVVAEILAAVDEATAAIKAYYMTQVGSVENPADFTIFIQNPWFINTNAEPILEDGFWNFPNRYNEEDDSENYVSGSASSPDLNSTGWYIAGAEGGDQRLNWQCERSCWNAWNSNYTSTLAIAQDIEGLPNGYYTVSADMITQSGYANGTQHVFAKSVAEKKISSNETISEGYDYADWGTVTMTADEKVLVVDGKLTIGAEGTGDGNASAGWFLATNFHLYYLGEAPADALKNAFEAKVAAAQELAAKVPFKVDQNALNDSIAKVSGTTDYLAGLNVLNAAMDEANKSIALYVEYIPEDGTIEGKTLPTVYNTLKKNGGEGYGAAEDIVSFAYDYVMDWIKGETASYKEFEATVDLLKNYLNTYTPAYNNAAKVAASASEKGKAVLNDVMAAQKAVLISAMQDKATVDAYVEKLNLTAQLVQKQNIYDNPDATDYTAFIQNPKLESDSGWTFNRGNGNNNTNSGQWYDGSDTRYIDSYNEQGLQGYSAMQLITGLPNGTYKLGVYTRTPAEGAYICYAVGNDTTFVEIPLDYYQAITAEGADTTIVASDTHGPIWEEALKAIDSGDYTDEQYAIYNANFIDGESAGRGWKHQEIDNIVVTDHELLIGTMAGTEASKTPKVFAGNWYSAGGWTLTLIARGDNTDWGGPIEAGVHDLKVDRTMSQSSIYTLTGARVSNLKRGLNIIVSDGKVRKVLVK